MGQMTYFFSKEFDSCQILALVCYIDVASVAYHDPVSRFPQLSDTGYPIHIRLLYPKQQGPPYVMPQSADTVSLAITGASGAPYGLRLLEALLQAGKQVYLMVSSPAQVVLATETELQVPGRPEAMQEFFAERFGAAPGQLQVFGREQWLAPVASGSSAPPAMVICPCSTSTLSSVATGASNTLIERAADVMLKERRQLLMVLREMPLSAIHLEHMLKLAQLGVTIMPASPGFYHRPQSVAEMVDFVVARVLDHLGIEQTFAPRWGEGEQGG